MRTLTLTAIAAIFAAGSFAASAAETKTAAVSCTKLDEAACQAPDCTWHAATTTKKGKEKKAYCSKAAKAKKAKKAA